MRMLLYWLVLVLIDCAPSPLPAASGTLSLKETHPDASSQPRGRLQKLRQKEDQETDSDRPRDVMPAPSLLRDVLGTLGRIGVRAVAKAAESVLEDVGTVAENVTKKTHKVRKGLGRIPRERTDDDGEE
jgi:hypothetical protein